MAYAKYGANSPEWWKHLREAKRTFWKKVRNANKNKIAEEFLSHDRPNNAILQNEMRRPERLAEALKEEIAEVVGFELDDPRVQSAIVTDVNVSDNLRDAKVFVLVEGSEDEIGNALRTLERAAPFVRQQIALNLNLRHVPQLHFVRDTAEENAARVGEILEDLTSKGEFIERTEMRDGG